MAEFKSRLKLSFSEEYDDVGPWWVIEPFIYKSDVYKGIITVPVGYPTDLSSVPRVPIIYELTGNSAIKPAVIHDFLYTSKIVDRKTADRIFKEACVVALIPAWKRNLMWAGIRLFGTDRYGT